MIQRIQTIYLLISIACLSIVTFGRTVLVHFMGTTMENYELTVYGIVNQEKIPLESGLNLPLYILSFLLIALLLFTAFSFKNLKRQGLLISISIVLYALLIAAILAIYFLNNIKIEDLPANAIISSGFYILGIGLPALFLANNGIKRDKKLIDSLNRLR